ncbi:MAG: murein L,D-transpeptidase catalytic domain-containing protein [Sediminibacterium sp.]
MFRLSLVALSILLFNLLSAQTRFANLQPTIKNFIQQQKMEDRFCFLVDLQLHNGKKRFFIYDILKDSILNAGMVTHGSCREYYLSDVRYSNQPGSECSSKGKYKIGPQYYGLFGKSYKLFGLDSTNNNAFKRSVVLHAHSSIPDKESYPNQIPNSQGCPTVSPYFLGLLSKYITQSKKPILLWVLDRR